MLNEVKKYPTNGENFIMTWMFNGMCWSSTCCVKEDILMEYQVFNEDGDCVDDFIPFEISDNYKNIQYWVNDKN